MLILRTRPETADPVGNDPSAIAITPDGKTAYVANTFSDTVSQQPPTKPSQALPPAGGVSARNRGFAIGRLCLS